MCGFFNLCSINFKIDFQSKKGISALFKLLSRVFQCMTNIAIYVTIDRRLYNKGDQL